MRGALLAVTCLAGLAGRASAFVPPRQSRADAASRTALSVAMDKNPPAVGAPDASATGVVRAPIDKVWELFRPFGSETMQWWPIYESMSLDGGKDEVGAVRSFKTKSGRSYQERLVARDDKAHTETYELVSLEPSLPTFDGATTVVSMSDLGDGTTQVAWQSWSRIGGAFKGAVTEQQSATYRDAIKSLDAHFNPAIGTLSLTLLGCTDISDKHVNAYVSATLDHSQAQTSKTAYFTKSPVWNEELTFDVLSAEGVLTLAVCDAEFLQDEVIGTTDLDLHKLQAGEVAQLALPLGSGGAALKVEALLSMADADANGLPATGAMKAMSQVKRVGAVVEELKNMAMDMVQQLAAGPQEKLGYARYPRLKGHEDVDYENLPRMVDGLPFGFQLSPSKIGRMTQRATEYGYSQIDFLERLQKAVQGGGDPFEAYYGEGYLPQDPFIKDHWTEDTEMARQMLNGLNPHVISKLHDAAQLPPSLRAGAAQLGGEALEDIAARGDLFLCDYSELADGVTRYSDMVYYGPRVLVYKRSGEEELRVGAVQLEDGGEVYTADATPKNRWLFAKIHVACADNQVHQFKEHLGFAHLAMEPFVIATYNALGEDHVIGKLLRPHFHDTIGINFLARQTLVSTVIPFTDQTFAPGTAGALAYFLKQWKAYNFPDMAFDKRLEARGFDEAKTDGVKDYYYRDDGFRLWNCIGKYVSIVVDKSYADDGAIATDAALQAWVAELRDPQRADIPGFPEIRTKEALAAALQTVIWSVSAAHSCVNFPQYEFLKYVPNRPDSLTAPMPPGTDEIGMDVIVAALPSVTRSQFQVLFSWLLTTPSEAMLTDVDAMKDVVPEAYTFLSDELKAISADIQKRNAALMAKGLPPYPWLDPANTASSIAI